ncbi:MAG: hypothetical protein RLZZ292_2257 [Bacteroidota bacterium]|jgi:hypothetical protein
MELHLKIIGLLFIALSLVHVIFPNYFDWKKDLAPLQLINRQMMYVHTFFVALVVLLMGVLCWTSAEDLIHTLLEKRICLGFALFWTLRLMVQFVGYSSELWKGKRFETVVHIFFSLFWAYVSAIFWLSYYF